MLHLQITDQEHSDLQEGIQAYIKIRMDRENFEGVAALYNATEKPMIKLSCPTVQSWSDHADVINTKFNSNGDMIAMVVLSKWRD